MRGYKLCISKCKVIGYRGGAGFLPPTVVHTTVAEGSLEVKVPTIWTDRKAEVERDREERREKRRREKIREETESEERRYECAKR